ncbi:MAG: NUDIX hydrolase [Emcibacteraceae bacterium]|nr:NUDIX hydrolase [Emcibacteraceae bacterium]MDG1857866.1 NUDIX hydrolase [Emcibacteraceae bacterium]
MQREYPNNPIPAIGTVVFKDDQVLLIQRNKPPKKSEWSIPGGAQNLGETLKHAAAREVREETGIEIINITLVDTVDYIKKDDKGDILYHYSLIDYMADYLSGELIAGDDALSAKWVPITELPSYNLWEATIKLIEDAIALKKCI